MGFNNRPYKATGTMCANFTGLTKEKFVEMNNYANLDLKVYIQEFNCYHKPPSLIDFEVQIGPGAPCRGFL